MIFLRLFLRVIMVSLLLTSCDAAKKEVYTQHMNPKNNNKISRVEIYYSNNIPDYVAQPKPEWIISDIIDSSTFICILKGDDINQNLFDFSNLKKRHEKTTHYPNFNTYMIIKKGAGEIKVYFFYGTSDDNYIDFIVDDVWYITEVTLGREIMKEARSKCGNEIR